MIKTLKKIKRLLPERDIKYLIYERYALWIGILTISINKVLYRKRLQIQPG